MASVNGLFWREERWGTSMPDKNIEILVNEGKLTFKLPRKEAEELIKKIQTKLAFHPTKPVVIVFDLERDKNQKK